MMRYSVIGFVAGIAACIGWRLAPHSSPASPIVPSAMASPSPVQTHAPAPMPTYDVAPLVVTTAAPLSEPLVAGLARPAVTFAKPIAPPRVPVVVRRPAPQAPAAPSATSTPKEDEMLRARHDFAAASAELGATL